MARRTTRLHPLEPQFTPEAIGAMAHTLYAALVDMGEATLTQLFCRVTDDDRTKDLCQLAFDVLENSGLVIAYQRDQKDYYKAVVQL